MTTAGDALPHKTPRSPNPGDWVAFRPQAPQNPLAVASSLRELEGILVRLGIGLCEVEVYQESTMDASPFVGGGALELESSGS
ncbi:MAG TPA: hypothetical protein VFV87_00860 [Pirellulaceae bacterium]|nr:hypothetical protein [Pirellulaceae bacterium]